MPPLLCRGVCLFRCPYKNREARNHRAHPYAITNNSFSVIAADEVSDENHRDDRDHDADEFGFEIVEVLDSELCGHVDVGADKELVEPVNDDQ